MSEMMIRPEQAVGKTITNVQVRRMAGHDTYKDWHTWTETILVFHDGKELSLGGDDTEVFDAFEYDYLTPEGEPIRRVTP